MNSPVLCSSTSFIRLVLPRLGRRTRSIATAASRPSRVRCRTSTRGAAAASFTKTCRLLNVRAPPVPYGVAWRWQHMLAEELRRNYGTPDSLIVLEHQPVYTLGTASKFENVLFRALEIKPEDLPCADQVEACNRAGQAPEVVRTERGGEVTYHGPGQLIAYPILNLDRHRRDLHWYLRNLEETIIILLRRHYGVVACRKAGMAGVWVNDAKICAMGLKVSKWVTMHGLALNITTDLTPFQRIVPCGISEFGVTSLERLMEGRQDISMDLVREQFLQSFDEVFGPYDRFDDMSVDQLFPAAKHAVTKT